MKKGLSDAMKNYDRYLLAKYRQSKKQVSMIDAIRMCHTKHTTVNNEAINELVYDKLRNETTWEAVSSKAGTDAEKLKKMYGDNSLIKSM